MRIDKKRVALFSLQVLAMMFVLILVPSLRTSAYGGNSKQEVLTDNYPLQIETQDYQKSLDQISNITLCDVENIRASTESIHTFLQRVDENIYLNNESAVEGNLDDYNFVYDIPRAFNNKEWDSIVYIWEDHGISWVKSLEEAEISERSKLTLANALIQANIHTSNNFTEPLSIRWNDIYSVLNLKSNSTTSWTFGYIGYFFENVYKSISAISDNDITVSNLSRGELEIIEDPYDFLLLLAKKNTSRALCEAEAVDHLSSQEKDGIYKWQWQLARLLKYEGSILEADRMYRLALDSVALIKNEFVSSLQNRNPISEDIRYDFLTKVESLYREYIDLLTINSFTDNANERAKETLISLQFSDLENLLECEIDTSSLIDLDNALEYSDSRTAVVYPIILDNRLEILWKLPGQSLSRTTVNNVADAELEYAVTKFRYELEKPYFSSIHGKTFAIQLYEWLIRPIEQDIQHAQKNASELRTIVFVLDGVLRDIPMSALYDKLEEKYLIEKYAISVSVGGLALPRSQPDKNYRALLAGLSQKPVLSRNEKDESLYGNLEHVDNEISQISEAIPNSSIIKNQNFTFQNLKKEIESSDYNLIHLATHGNFAYRDNRDQDAGKTYILIAENPEDKNVNSNGNSTQEVYAERLYLKCSDQEDNLLCIEDIFEENRKSIQLIVLSACETAAGDERAILGIAGVAVKSGARSVLATLWSVDDLSSVLFMQKFYSYLINEKSLSKAEALQKTQIDLLQDGASFRPSNWAPYVLVGDWR